MLSGNLEVSGARLGGEALVLDDQGFDVALHRSQRRAQVMRDVRDEFAA